MMSDTYILTPAEKKVIDRMRAEEHARSMSKTYCLELLTTALEYEKWLRKNGAVNSFSTFVDEFGYARTDQISVKMIYDCVNTLRRSALDTAQEMANL